jgi:hypothetical protein
VWHATRIGTMVSGSSPHLQYLAWRAPYVSDKSLLTIFILKFGMESPIVLQLAVT